MKEIFQSKELKRLLTISIIALLGLVLAYSNHFDNGFHFDDTHTISYNEYIKDIGNIPLFFTDITTFGTMPNNRTYRPVVTTLNTIDYWLGGELKPFYFHLSIFIWYLVQLVLMYFFIQKIYSFTIPKAASQMAALLSVIFYAFHAANAETINYIIMRSDSFSTLCVIASFLLYQSPRGKKYHLYLISLLIGTATKESALMFIPLLFLYVFLFEENGSFMSLHRKESLKAILSSFVRIIPALIIGGGFFMFSRMYFRPEASLFFAVHPSPVFSYFITQWFVITHYIGNFILPLDLSADPDIFIIHDLFNRKILLSLMLLLTLLVIAIKTSAKHKPIAFGILWFFIALAPTSSIKPFGQISNDHRTFFAYIGFIISLGYYGYYLWEKNKSFIIENKLVKNGLSGLFIGVILLHAFGTYQRNKVWDNEESLWEDVAKKSPKNGRGLMNYGLTKMQKGQYEEALKYFNNALQTMPYYSYLHINLGILKSAMGKPVEAEQFFKNALKYDASNAEAYYFYARFLANKNQNNEAIELLTRGREISPGHSRTAALLAEIQAKSDNFEKLKQSVENNPTYEGYIQLGIKLYQSGDYTACVEVCKKAIEINPNKADAYNNMCSAYILLGETDEAIEACNKAIEIRPDFELAKNNLRWAKTVQSEQN